MGDEIPLGHGATFQRSHVRAAIVMAMRKLFASLLLLLCLTAGCDRQKAKSELSKRGSPATDGALVHAASAGDDEAVKLLLRAGRSGNAIDEATGRTPLINAAENGH